MQRKIAIAVALGDGIGPDLMQATLHILQTAGALLEIHPITFKDKIDLVMWDVFKNTQALLKAPLTKNITPILCKHLGLYASVQPCISYFPWAITKHPEMNVVIIQDTSENISSSLEYKQTPNTSSFCKITSSFALERIIRYAFEYALAHKRKKVTCFTQNHLLPFSSQLFQKTFEKISQDYPTILNESWEITQGVCKLADTPEIFDVIVLPNLHGNIVSSLARDIAGSLALASSSYIGNTYALFETCIDPMPFLTQKNTANPSGLILAAIQMLVHLGQKEIATNIHNAFLRTLEEGILTADLLTDQMRTKQVGTQEFADAIIKNFQKKPQTLEPVIYPTIAPKKYNASSEIALSRQLQGLDVTIYHKGALPQFLSKISHINIGPLRLKSIANQGVRIWPNPVKETNNIEQFLCRFLSDDGRVVVQKDVLQVLQAFDHVQIEIINCEFLYAIDGLPGYLPL